MSDEWIKRQYIQSEDENALLSLWCKSYERSAEGIARGAFVPGGANVSNGARDAPEVRAASRAMWAEQAPLVEVLLASTDVEVVCDPQRPLTTAEGPAVIWAFARNETTCECGRSLQRVRWRATPCRPNTSITFCSAPGAIASGSWV